jgi:PAS domain S-box-containing protein
VRLIDLGKYSQEWLNWLKASPQSMVQLTLDSLGIIGLLLGLAFLLLTFLLTRILPRAGVRRINLPDRVGESSNPTVSDGLLLIKNGGRIAYLNQEARAWFGFTEKEPDLEQLARRAIPSDALLDLCASEGQRQFSVNGIYVEATSSQIPYEGSAGILVSMRQPGIHALTTRDPKYIENALQSFFSLSQAISANLDLEATLQAVIESVIRLIPCDIPEITIWDPDNKILLPYRFKMLADDEQKLEKTAQRYRPDQGYSGYLITGRKPLLIDDVDNFTTVRPAVDRDVYHFKSYLGVPLLTAGELVGTVELTSLKENAFTQADLDILEMISGHAAVALHNAVLYRRQQSRVLELTGLAQLAHAVGTFRELTDLYASLVESIRPLLNVEMIGFWIYEENQHILQAQVPFIGIPPQFINLYRINIDPGSHGEEILFSQQAISTSDASNDPMLVALKLDAHAQAAGMRDTMLVPLTSGGKILGYLQVANKLDQTPFDQDDLRLLSIIAGQAAITIENATLVQQSKSRAQRAEALRKIASLTQSVATLDEILQFSLRELARLLKADTATIFLQEESSGEVRLHKPSLFGISTDILKRLGQISIDLSQHTGPDGSTRMRSFMSGNANQDPKVPPSYLPLIHLFGVQSIISVPLVMRNYSVGQIFLGSRADNHFDHNDVILIDTAAGQLAGAIEQSTLLAQTDENLRRRVDQLTSLTRISRELNSAVGVDQILRLVYDELMLTTQADCGSIILFKPAIKDEEIPTISFQIGDQHSEVLSEVEVKVFQEGQTILIDELPQLADDQPGLSLPHEGICSALIVPIANQGEIVGLVHLHARQPNRFDQTALEIAESLANQTAIAIWKTNRYQEHVDWSELQDQNEALGTLHKDTQKDHSLRQLRERMQRIQAGLGIAEVAVRQTTPVEVLKSLGQEMVSRLNIDIALAAEIGEGGPHLVGTFGMIPEAANPEALLGQRNPLRHCMQFGKNILVPELAESPEWQHSLLLQTLNAQAFICLAIPGYQNRGEAEPDDIETIAPVGAVLGISHMPLAPFMPEDEQFFILLARQISAALESLQLLSETKRRLHEVNSLLEFSQQLGSLEPISILHTLVASALKVVPVARTCMVALWDADKGCLVPQLASGYTENDSILDICYHPGEGLPALAYEQGQPLRIDLVDFPKHYNLPPEQLLRYRDATEGRLPLSCLVVPVGGNPTKQQDARGKLSPRLSNPVGVLVLENFDTPTAFRLEDQQLVSSLAYQTALTLDNARLFQASEQRAVQLHALTKLAATITSSLQTDELTSSLLNELKTIIRFDTGTLWIRQEDKLKVFAAHGFTDNEERVGLTVPLEDSRLLKEMISSGEPINAKDIRQDPRFLSSAEPEYLSWLGVPLLSKGDVIGVIALEKKEKGYYTADDIHSIATFAVQAAVALQNARLFAETQRLYSETAQKSNELTGLFEVGYRLSQVLDQNLLVETIFDKLSELLDVKNAAVILKNETDALTAQYMHNRNKLGLQPYDGQFETLIEHVLNQGENLLIDDLQADMHTSPETSLGLDEPVRAWFGVPLMGRGVTLGVLTVQSEIPFQFDEPKTRFITQIANQLAVALDNARLFSTVQRYASDLEKRVEKRTTQLGREYARNETLLSIMSQLSTSLDMDLVLNRTLGLINEKIGAQHSLIMLLQPDKTSLFLRAALGSTHVTPEGGQPTTLKANEGLVGWVITNRKPALISDLTTDPRWLKLDDQPPPNRSAIAVPLIIGDDVLGALLLYHQEAGMFNEDQLDLAQATAKQIAVAINNSQLYHLIRDQAERLGEMLHSQHVESSRLQAILEAVADGVLVTDAKQVVTLFNHSAEKILDLSRQQVLGQSLDNFRGLFGKAAHTWVETIHNWSANPDTYLTGDIYSERINLEDGRVISVHLSPVYLKSDFLGTVSIFRDISHQVEVDRLKSEFVATVSHELRTPMTSIKGYVEILLMGAAGSLDAKQAHYLEIVKANTERLAILVNDLLDISRIETGRVILSPQPLDLYDVIGKALEEIKRRGKAEGKTIQTKADLPAGVPCVIADRERVLQILSNLLENAYLYTPENGRILVKMQLHPGEVQIDIKDNGIGIKAQDQLHIFERFYRGEDPLVLEASGTGLGLSIVQRLVDMHHGRIWFTSSGINGEGTTFSFTLPVNQEEIE